MGPFIQPALYCDETAIFTNGGVAVTMYASYSRRTIVTWCRHMKCRAGEVPCRLLPGRRRGGGGAGARDVPGAGSRESARSAGGGAPLGGLGFFGRITLFRGGFGGGPAGRSSANTGLGSIVTDAGVVKSPGNLVACTCTVAGWNPFIEKVTLKPPSGTGTAAVQGVLQPGPTEVRASAPCGVESSCTCTVGGGGGEDLKASIENEEQPARLNPAAAITMTRRMINPSLYCG